MNSLKKIRQDLDIIKQRNTRVETDKAWERSLTRKMIIAVLTYLVVVLFFIAANLPKPYLNSLIPTLGFILSTLSLPMLKQLWLKSRNRS